MVLEQGCLKKYGDPKQIPLTGPLYVQNAQRYDTKAKKIF